MAENKFPGPISSTESRLTLMWKNTYEAYDIYSIKQEQIKFSERIPPYPGPGKTQDSQWDIGTKKLALYNNTSEPEHHMQNVTFLCEFDSSTNLAPLMGGTDPSESPETYPEVLQTCSGNVTAIDQFTVTTPDNLDGLLDDLDDIAPDIKQYWLRIKSSGDNQGYYPIISDDSNIITIDPLGSYGGLTVLDPDETLNAVINVFTKGDDIQADLQSGKFFAYVFIHSWPSYWNTNKLHTFKVTPYYLIKSSLDSTGIVPVWSFQCKSTVQEIDHAETFGARFKDYWGNYT